MKRPSFLRALAVAACVLSAAPALAAQTPPPAAALSEARELIRDGRFDDALGILRPLAGAARGNARFLLGLAAVGAAEKPGIDEDSRDALLDEAIAAFRAMLVVDLEAGPGPPGARPRVLPEGRGRACDAAFRAGAGGPASGGGGAQRQPVPQHHARPQAVERCGSARRSRPTATSPPGRAKARSILIDTPFGRLPFTYRRRLRPGRASGHRGVGRRRIPVPAIAPLAVARGRRRLAARIPLH